MEIFFLILRIIELILKGMSAVEATKVIAEQSGVGFEKLWGALGDKYK